MLDQFRNINLEWNLANKSIYERVEAVASDDKGRKLVVQVLNDNKLINAVNCTLRLYWRYLDNKGFDEFDVVDAEKGIFEVYFSRQMLENIGNLNAWLHLTDTTGVITSKGFQISVFKGIDNGTIEASDEFNALNRVLVKLEDYDTEFENIKNNIETEFDQLEQDFSNRAENLEETYAPRLTKVENNKADNVDLANTNEKLAIVKQRKADRSYVDRTKRSKEEKINPDDLSIDVINLVTGESEVLLNSIPQDYSVTANKLDKNLKSSLVLPVYNTINNGDFGKGVDGWSFYRGSGTVLEGILSLASTPNSSYTSISQTTSTLGYGNLYLETRVKIPSEHSVDEIRLRIEIDGIVRNIELKTDFEKDRWFTLSGRFSADVHENCVISFIYYYEQGSQPVIELDYITCIDISEVPYTPTNSEIDVFLNNYSKRWYEGEGNWVSLENIYKEQAFLSNIMAEQDEEWKI